MTNGIMENNKGIFYDMDKIVDIMDNAINDLNMINSKGKMRNPDGIITEHIYPPIPIRNYDWSAIRADYDEGDLIGYGRTEQEAIDNLKEQENN